MVTYCTFGTNPFAKTPLQIAITFPFNIARPLCLVFKWSYGFPLGLTPLFQGFGNVPFQVRQICYRLCFAIKYI